MTFFDMVNDILFHKRGDKLSNVDHDQHLIPFLINRWISMYNGNMCRYINDTMNRYPGLFQDKRDIYRSYIHMIPRMKQRFIKYIKKNKKDSEQDDEQSDNVSLLARELELSEREINMYIQHERQYRSTHTD